MGNISTYSSPDEGSFTYTYDNQGQLTKAVNGSTTYTYSYDGAGNILSKSDGTTSHSYSYTDYDWRDLLTAYDGQTISYDGAGNPTSYYNGTRWTFTWGNGRRLETASNGSSNLSYNYTADGIRTSKTANGVTHTYYYSGNILLRETYGDTTLDFFYDSNGTPAALKHNNNLYYYITNLQGDVIRLVDANGNTVALYKYDPYGNPIHASGSLATINPLRYRGYYYDSETGLYYLQSRYYDPVVGRFISADSYTSTGQGIIGNNMFAYCGNNPVVHRDADGKAFDTVIDAVTLAASIAEVAANPADLWAWASLSGDLVDVLLPFVTGVGETVKAVSATAKVVDAVDDAADAAKAVSKSTRNARRTAVRKAWKNEVELVRNDRPSRYWEPDEIQELLTTGKVRGYEGHHIKNVRHHPDLAGDPQNIQFLTRTEHLAAHRGSWRNKTTKRYAI